MTADLYFQLVAWDGDNALLILELDDYQVVLDSGASQIRIALTGEQLADARKAPSLAARTIA